MNLLENLGEAEALKASVLDEEISNLSTKFDLKTLPDIVEKHRHSIKRGPFGSALKKSFFVKKGYKVYQQSNAINDDFNLGDYYINDEKYKELEAFKVKPKDIIISCSGTIGRTAIAPKGIEEGIINQALLKISLDTNKITHQYFVYFFNNYVNMGQLKTKGAAIKNIVSVKELKKIPIPLPPLEIQHQIVSKLDTLFSHIDGLISEITEKIENLEALKGSLLDKAFKGEL